MTSLGLAVSDSVQDEIVELIATLQHAERRLDELTGGQVDTVMGATGRPFLLRRAQEEMRTTGAAEQAAMVEALRASELEFRTLAESMPQIVWVTRPDGWTTYLSQQWIDYSGLTIEQSLGEGWAASFHPDDRQRALENWRLAASKGDVYAMECRIRSADGAYRWWLVRGVPQLGSKQGITKWFGTCTDIHELKLAQIEVARANAALQEQQDELRVLFDIMPAMVWFKDTEDRILRVNQRVADFAGRTIAEIEGRPASEIRASEDAEGRADDLAVMASGLPKLGVFESVPAPGGESRWMRTDKVPVRDKDGRITGIVVMSQDVTGLKRLEEQLRHSQKMEAMGTLAGGIAHDFNNILGAIIGYTEMARGKVAESPAVASEYLDSVLHGAHRAAALVRQILAFSRQEEASLASAQLAVLVAEPVNLLRATIPSTITFDVSIPGALPLVLADATQVHQVVMNLCTNAWHAMQGGPGRLSVRLERILIDDARAQATAGLQAGTYVMLSVTDTGHGMDRATRDRIFEPFFTTKAPGHGTGLGLPVVHGIVKRHGGAIAVDSRSGEGTTFRVYFPALAAGVVERMGPGPCEGRGRGESVLFIDDDEALTKLAPAMLEKLGYVATTSCDPVAALEAVRAEPSRFALVISDFTMPVMTGIDLAARLHEIRPDLPVILTTGLAERVTAESMGSAGVHGLLQKPYTLAMLSTMLQGVMDKTRED